MRRLLFILLGVLVISSQLLAQNRTITGRITDAQGNGIPASVSVKGSTIGTATAADGSFTLSVPSTAKALLITSVGFQSQEITIGTQSVITTSLALESTPNMEEIIVTVPYGTIKKTAFTGAEGSISAKTIQRQQVTSVTKALEGQVAGLVAVNGGGAPGTGTDIRIRGFGSINSSNTPLYVLNGVPYDGSIAAIATDDIESVSVLKDAAAAALYGSRAGNGVIMITTKKGRAGKANINATFRQGFMSRGIPEYDRVNTQDYYELFWEAYRNAYVAQGQTRANAGILASNVLTGPNGLVYNAYNVPGNKLIDSITGKINPSAQLLWQDSWEDALFQTALRTNANVNVSGGSDRTDYYLSAGYLNEEGILKFSNYRRYNLRMNVNTAPTSWFNTGINLDGSLGKRDDVPSGGTATTNPFYYSRQMGPIYPVYERDEATGNFVIDPLTGQNALDWGVPAQMGTRPYAGRSNLLGSLDLDDRYSNIGQINANTFGDIKFLKDFSFRASIGVNYLSNSATNYQNNQYGDAAPTNPQGTNGGRSTKSNTTTVSYTANQVLNWNKTFDRHSVRALVGHENYSWTSSGMSANQSGFLFPGQNELTNGTAPFGNPSSYTDKHRIESYFTGINYDFDQKYLASLSYRTDGSSRFEKDTRWGNFYSAGLGWRISQENFMKNVGWVNELKLRASYGESGNEDIGFLYEYRAYYYANGNGSYSTPQRPPNDKLQWETNRTINIGLDFAILKNRLQGTIEWYKRESDDLIFDVPLSFITGNLSVLRNIGKMDNTGIELQLGYTAIQSKNFNWRIDLNLSHVKNEITKLPDVQKETGILSGTKRLLEGHSLYDFWLKEYAGVDASNGDALYYMDVLGTDGKPTGQRTLTNVWNNATYYYHGDAIPDLNGGLTNSFRYQNFELSFLATFAYGGLFYDGNYAGIMHRGDPGISWHADIAQRWQKPGDITNVPRLENAIGGQTGASTRWLFDASYLNIKNITVSYNLPAKTANRMHLNGVQIFANVDNAYLFTGKKGMDPQRSFAGTADATYPPYRTINFGINVNLQ
jgi:TonB-linked SusC/RagA family outer membrane protein